MAKWNTITNPNKWNGITKISKINVVPFSYLITLTSAVTTSYSDGSSYFVGYTFYASAAPTSNITCSFIHYYWDGSSVVASPVTNIIIGAGATSGSGAYMFDKAPFAYSTNGSYSGTPAGCQYADGMKSVIIPAL